MDVSGILSKVKSGGFVNPIGSKVQGALDSLTLPTLDQFKSNAASQAATAGVPVPSTIDLEQGYDKVVDAYNRMGDLIGHSDKLSGVNLSGDSTLATIAKTVNAAKNINGDKTCSAILGAFGTITKAAELVNDTLNTVDNIQKLLDDIPGQIELIPQLVQSYADIVANQILSDTNTLLQAQLDVVQNSVATSLVSLFQDECAAQILSSVMGAELKNEVSKVSDSVKAATSKAIFGN